MRALLAVILLTGCAPTTAVIDGRRIVRPTFGYSDHRYYAVAHSRAYPIHVGPSDGVWSYAGYVSGTVCGADVRLDGELYGRLLDVSGFVSSVNGGRTRPLRFTVEDDRRGVRHIMGQGADLELTPTWLSGSITL